MYQIHWFSVFSCESAPEYFPITDILCFPFEAHITSADCYPIVEHIFNLFSVADCKILSFLRSTFPFSQNTHLRLRLLFGGGRAGVAAERQVDCFWVWEFLESQDGSAGERWTEVGGTGRNVLEGYIGPGRAARDDLRVD